MPRWSATTGSDTTVWPTETPAVPGPGSSTSAANSWPITRSRPVSNTSGVIPTPADAVASFVSSTMRSACWAACRSEPQMPHAFVCTSTCPSPGTGSATSSTTMRPPRSTAAFISTAPSFLLFLGVLLDGLHDGGARPAHQLGPVGDRPVPGLHERARRVLERRHNLAGEQLIGPQRRLWVGPVVGQQEVRAEPARLVGQPLQLGDGLLWRADHRESVV